MKIGLVAKPTLEDEPLRALQAAITRLRAAGHVVRAHRSRHKGDARRFARAAARAGCEIVIAAGGDGTVNEVVNGLARAGTDARLGIVPLGTANDFARGLGLPLDVGTAFDVAMTGAAVPLDLGCVNGRYFVNVSTGGFGARATTSTPRALKRLLGPVAYLISGARQLSAMKPQRARFTVDDAAVYEGEFVFFTCGNGVRTGGGTRIAPRAAVDDGQLDVIILPWVSKLEFLSLLPDLRSGGHLESPDVLYLRASRFEVRAEEIIPANVDGEPLDARHYAYSVHARPIAVLVPQADGREVNR